MFIEFIIQGMVFGMILKQIETTPSFYEIESSILNPEGLNSSLYKTSGFGQGNRWTISLWFKRLKGNGDQLWSSIQLMNRVEPQDCIISGGGTGPNDSFRIGFGQAGLGEFDQSGNKGLQDNLYISDPAAAPGGGWSIEDRSGRNFRDRAAWYHLHLSFDLSLSEEDRAQLHINGERIYFDDWTVIGTGSRYPSQESGFNKVACRIGGWKADVASNFCGQLADIKVLDNFAVPPERFAIEDGQGHYNPVAFSGSYGINGFHLPFLNGKGPTVIEDSSDLSRTAQFVSVPLENEGNLINVMGDSPVGGPSFFRKEYSSGGGLSVNNAYVPSFPPMYTSDIFTFEFWVRDPVGTFCGNGAWYMYNRDEGGATDGWGIYWPHTAPFFGDGYGYYAAGLGVLNDGQWHHLCIERSLVPGTPISEGRMFVYYDGVQVGYGDMIAPDMTSSGSGTTHFIGDNGGGATSGDWAEIRWSEGLRYNGNGVQGFSFVPQTEPFVTDSNTQILIQSNYHGDIGVGADYSGQENHFDVSSEYGGGQLDNITPNHILTDSPTNNFCVLNILDASSQNGFAGGSAETAGEFYPGNLGFKTLDYRDSSMPDLNYAQGARGTMEIPKTGRWAFSAQWSDYVYTAGASREYVDGWVGLYDSSETIMNFYGGHYDPPEGHPDFNYDYTADRGCPTGKALCLTDTGWIFHKNESVDSSLSGSIESKYWVEFLIDADTGVVCIKNTTTGQLTTYTLPPNTSWAPFTACRWQWQPSIQRDMIWLCDFGQHGYTPSADHEGRTDYKLLCTRDLPEEVTLPRNNFAAVTYAGKPYVNPPQIKVNTGFWPDLLFYGRQHRF